MRRTLASIGIVGTAAYLGLVWYMFHDRTPELLSMAPNNVGDFLAGVFGPLSIFWLVLGFFQQGVELKQNTEALHLQASELRESVKQQKELVQVAYESLITERESLMQARERDREANNPKILVARVGYSRFVNGIVYHIVLVNTGAPAARVRLRPSHPPTEISTVSIALLETGSERTIDLRFPPRRPTGDEILSVIYLDPRGQLYSAEFQYVLGEDGLIVEMTPSEA